jgi:acid phosphatase (class A)
VNWRVITASPNDFNWVSTANPGPGSASGYIPIGVIEVPNPPPAHFSLVLAKEFPRRGWDPNLYAQAVLAEFAASNWASKVEVDPPPSAPGELAAEIAALCAHDQSFPAGHPSLRAQRLGEILAQAQDPTPYFADLLATASGSHPATWDLVAAAITIGQMVGMHFKLKFRRPRPAQLYPALMPLVLTPPHPSYPNNHALQSLLVARFVGAAAPALRAPLDALADRIGYNREIAGVHYPSDRVASRKIADQLVPLVEKGGLFSKMLEEAKEEWKGVAHAPFPSDRG